MKFKRRQNESTVTEIRTVVTSGLGGMDFPEKGMRELSQVMKMVYTLIGVFVN